MLLMLQSMYKINYSISLSKDGKVRYQYHENTSIYKCEKKNEVVCTEGKVCVHVGKKNEASKTNMNML